MRVKIEKLTPGNKIALEDGEEVVVTRVKAGDHSPFGQSGIGRFWHPRPFTIYYKDSKGEKGYAVGGASQEVEVK